MGSGWQARGTGLGARARAGVGLRRGRADGASSSPVHLLSGASQPTGALAQEGRRLHAPYTFSQHAACWASLPRAAPERKLGFGKILPASCGTEKPHHSVQGVVGGAQAGSAGS